jgi:hypothetical protein
MQLVIRDGEVLAVVGATRFYLAPGLDVRPANDSLRQVVSLLCEHVIAGRSRELGSRG